MRNFKILGLVAVTAALMVSTGSASATITSPPGTAYNGEIRATSSNVSFDGSVKVSCKKSTFGFSVENGATTGSITTLTFSECGSDTVTPLAKGTITTEPDGTIFTTGETFTVQIHRTVLGFPVTTHCLYETDDTHRGLLTENFFLWFDKIHKNSSPIPEEPTDSACGNDAVITGTYTIENPGSPIVVD